MGKLSRTSFTLPPDMIRNLDYVSGRLGVSRSAFLASIAGPALADVRDLLENCPGLPDAPESLRFRGESMALIRLRLDSLEKMMAGDLVTPANGHHG